jgi:hypothetical protein
MSGHFSLNSLTIRISRSDIYLWNRVSILYRAENQNWGLLYVFQQVGQVLIW